MRTRVRKPAPGFRWADLAPMVCRKGDGRRVLPFHAMDAISDAVMPLMKPGLPYTVRQLSALTEAPSAPLSIALRRAANRGRLCMTTRLKNGSFVTTFTVPEDHNAR